MVTTMDVTGTGLDVLIIAQGTAIRNAVEIIAIVFTVVRSESLLVYFSIE